MADQGELFDTQQYGQKIKSATLTQSSVSTRNTELGGDCSDRDVADLEHSLDPQKIRKPWQKSYNGWDWSARCAVTPIQNKAVKDGKLIRPTTCSICGHSKPDAPKGAGYIFMHTERYDRPLDINPCCKRCHSSLHARFDDPERWIAVVKCNWRQGAWFTLLSMDPVSQTQPFEITYPMGLPPRD